MCKITFFGKNNELEASKWGTIEPIKENKNIIRKHWVDINEQIGSDEVGVGDFLLPMIVVATYLTKNDISLLKELGVDDSKKLTDEKIKEIAPILSSKIIFSKLTLPNEKYNEMILKGENLNSLKAKMHNRALSNLNKKYPGVNGIYVDQFVSPNKYYEYIAHENEIVKGISFKTKGESYFPSVAAASVIARYAFLLEREKLNNKYNVEIPFGASSKVDEFSKKFVKKYGIDEFKEIAKINFANFKNL